MEKGGEVTVRIGCGAGWSRDRFGPAEELVSRGELDYLFLDAMSEITMSAHQVARRADPELPGWDPYLLKRLAPLLEPANKRRTKLITNQGWLDADGAAETVADEAREQGLTGLTIAAVSGSEVTGLVTTIDCHSIETGRPMSDYADDIVVAEAYLGAAPIAEAVRSGADIVLTSRVTDASLVLGPLIAEFGWSAEDWTHLAYGQTMGHLLECGPQVSGGYFADPGYKDVPDLANVGYPIAEIDEDSSVITKLDGTGGLVATATCAEQLLYEIQDPRRFMSPDVIADLTTIHFADAGPNRVRVTGGGGAPAPATLKALVGVFEGYITEQMVLFAGPGALARAELARDVLRTRLESARLKAREMRFDFVGRNAVHRESTVRLDPDPYEVVLRVCIATDTADEADKLRLEVDPLAVSGPAGTGKYATMGSSIRPVIGLHSTLIPRELVTSRITYRTT
jgi:Acyclic terpene utilisation family protein AtuA